MTELRFPLLILEPSGDYSETFLWRLYEKCRLEDRYCELLSRYVFDAARRPPLNLMYQKEAFNGSFGFFDCESALALFRASLEARKAEPSPEPQPFCKLFLLSLRDIYYDLPYEHLEALEPPAGDELRKARARLRRDCAPLRRRERENLLALLREGESHGIRLILSADRAARDRKLIREAEAAAAAVLVRDRRADTFDVFAGGEAIGRLSAAEAEALLLPALTRQG